MDVKLEAEETIRLPKSALAREELRPDAEPAGPMGVTAPPRGFEFSPLNARRWRNFKANRRGYYSLWLFLVLFIISLFAEFIANDRPLYIHVEGKNYFPVFVTYPDTEFGDTLGTAADYRDPYLQRFLDEHNAIVIWAPIRFSYRTINDRPPSAFPSKPTWLLNQRDCDFAAKNGYSPCDALEMNWLGTDDQGRDVLARLIYGFRISVLFGLILTIVSSIIGIAAGAVQGYFGGWTDLLFQRFIEIWTSVPELYLLLIISSVLVPGFFVLLGILLLFSWVRLVGLVRAEFLRGRNFEYIQAARARRFQPHHHVSPPVAERDGGDHDISALHHVVISHDADRARLPGLWPAAGLAVAWRTPVPRQGQRAGALARADRLLHGCADALAADLHRRGGA